MIIIEKNVNVTTQEETIIEREATKQEIAEAEAHAIELAKLIKANEEAATKKASALAKLAELGLSEDEIKAVFGF